VAISGSGEYSIKGDHANTGTAGYLYYSSGYGGTWFQSNSPNLNWRAVSMSASGQYAIASNNNNATLYYSMDYGQTWVTSVSTVQSFIVVSMSSSGQYALGCNNAPGRIYYSKDYGQTWTQSTASAPQAVWQSCAMSGTGQYALACIDSTTAGVGKVYYSINYGETWTPMSFTTTGRWYGVAISKSGQYAVGGISGNKIYYSSNTSTTTVIRDLADVFEPLYKYKTWTSVGGANTWSGISCSNDGKYVVACIRNASAPSGLIYYSSNYGASFNNSNATIANITGIAMSNTGQYAYACGYGSTSYTYISSNLGQAWGTTASRQGNFFLSIATSSNGLNFIASRDNSPTLSGGFMYYATNLGAMTLSTGTNPPCNFIALSGNGQYGIACPNANATVSGIYWSTNKGQTWTQYASLTTIKFGGCAISANGQYAIAGAASSGKIYYSNDFGVTWIASNSVSANWQGASMSDSGQYCIFALGNGNIAYSNDYGVNWTVLNAVGATGYTTNTVAMSKNGQYAFLTTSTGTIFRCAATNT
jgi:hypothetical protein